MRKIRTTKWLGKRSRKLAMQIAAGLIVALILLSTVLWLVPVIGRAAAIPQACEEFAFSTEEDFYTQGPTPPDGNPIISDGDLLGPNCVICARNKDLVGGFDVNQNIDLGLDAADVVDAETSLVAFSTELDSPNAGQFTAGDLLATNGTIIPNIALTDPFTVGHDIGLDSVHFVGEKADIVTFLTDASAKGRNEWVQSPGMLAEMLPRYGIDIWFSTEGTAPTVTQPAFLDGDLLSVATGTIIAPNSALLPSPSVPAGIPTRGVDFGLDGAASGREKDEGKIYFSTEILYEGDPIAFTDGDVLRYGTGAIDKTNWDLIGCFEPRAKELGLDALHIAPPPLDRQTILPLVLRDYVEALQQLLGN